MPDPEGVSYIDQFFKDKKNGYLIDVGASDGTNAGVMTRNLLKCGWSGMLIEPLPKFYRKLSDMYKQWPKVATVPVACSNEEGEAQLFPCGGVTTLNPEWRDATQKYWEHVNYKAPITVSKRTLRTLLIQYGSPAKIDLLKVDTEGHDLQVLQGMNWNYKPSLVCVESLDMCHLERRLKMGRYTPSPELVTYMEQMKYYCVKLTCGGNAIFLLEKEND